MAERSNRARQGLSLPDTILHADWSVSPAKRWVCRAIRNGGGYHIFAPQPVTDPSELLAAIPGERRLVGFDFPIGLPAAYADRAGLRDFKSALVDFGERGWESFFEVAVSRDDVSIHRPFYPAKTRGVRRGELLKGLGLSVWDELIRECEQRTDSRSQACSLFWTLGGNQVGRAAITGWRDVLKPALRSRQDVRLWPFDGRIEDLLRREGCVVVETYPAQAFLDIGLRRTSHRWSKRRQGDRRNLSDELLKALYSLEASASEALHRAISDGFGDRPDGEDRFDSCVGLLGVLSALKERRESELQSKQKIEGWIFGLCA